ncbi:MAG: hypothetical protein ACSHX7_08435 [Luteolibacter sp.]
MSGATGKELRSPHTGIAVLAIGAMTLVLAFGLDFLKVTKLLEAVLSGFFQVKALGEPVHGIGLGALWAGTAVLAFGLPYVILHVPGIFRRVLVWAGAFVFTVTWVPVLLLAAYKAEIGVAIVAVLWSGFCAMFYASNHDLPVDRTVEDQVRGIDGQS